MSTFNQPLAQFLEDVDPAHQILHAQLAHEGVRLLLRGTWHQLCTGLNHGSNSGSIAVPMTETFFCVAFGCYLSQRLHYKDVALPREPKICFGTDCPFSLADAATLFGFELTRAPWVEQEDDDVPEVFFSWVSSHDRAMRRLFVLRSVTVSFRHQQPNQQLIVRAAYGVHAPCGNLVGRA
jgi:hypothetical protein